LAGQFACNALHVTQRGLVFYPELNLEVFPLGESHSDLSRWITLKSRLDVETP